MSAPVSPPLNSASRFAHIDAIRAFAVMLVVVAHAGLGHVVPGGSGVTIFFSISGFIITYLLLRERDRTQGFSAGGFYLRRALKIMPPFILIIVFPTLIFSAWEDIDGTAFASQVFFVFNWWYIWEKGGTLDGTAVVWSLSIEEQFYILFAIVWLIAVKLKHWRVVMFITALLGIVYSTLMRVSMASSGPSLSERIYYGSDTRLDGIAWGVLAALAFHLWQEKGSAQLPVIRLLASDWNLVISIAIYLLSLLIRDEWFRDTFRYSLQSIATCSIICYGLLPGAGQLRRSFYKVSQLKAISLIGLSSYSIYLSHLLIMKWLREYLDMPLLAGVLVLSLAGVGAGIAVYKFVEVPFHKIGLRIRTKQTVHGSA